MIIARIIGRTRTTLSLLVLMVFVGLAARSALPIANDPHVDLPLFYVGVSHDGISPEDAERLLVQPMEIELRKLEGIVELKSTASEGMASFFVEFDVSQDLDKALSDVREAVDAAKVQRPTYTGADNAGQVRAPKPELGFTPQTHPFEYTQTFYPHAAFVTQ